MRVLVKSFTSMLVSLFMRTGCKMLPFCAREGPHAHARVERCTSTNTLNKSASGSSLRTVWSEDYSTVVESSIEADNPSTNVL